MFAKRTLNKELQSCTGLVFGVRVIFGALFVVALAIFGLAPGAGAQTEKGERDTIVVLTGGAEVDIGEQVDSVVVFDGDVSIAGTATDGVVAFNGDIMVTGTVDNEVVATNGRVTVAEGATVGGDVISSDTPLVEGTVGGEVQEPDFGDISAGASTALTIAWWLAVSASTFVLGLAFMLLLPRAVDAATSTFRDQPGPVIGWGLALAIAAPIVALMAFVTLLGIPLSLMLVALLGGFAAVGYVTTMHIVGRVALPSGTNLVFAFGVGWLALRLLELVPVVGDLVTAIAALIGLGALAMTGWRTARSLETTDARLKVTPA